MKERNQEKQGWKMEIKGKIPRGRLCNTWMENLKNYMIEKCLRDDDAQDRNLWRQKK